MVKQSLLRILLILAILIGLGIGGAGCNYGEQYNFDARPASRPSIPISGFESGIVKIVTGEGHGTGFVIGTTPDTIRIGTAAHVTKHQGLTVNGLPAFPLAIHPDFDLAIIIVPRPEGYIRVLRLAPVKLLEPVVAVGYAGSVDTILHMPGNVASVDAVGGYIVVNTGVQSGMSGGPILDAAGDVVGIVSHSPAILGTPNVTVLVAGPAIKLLDLLPK